MTETKPDPSTRVALVAGASRGIGAATAVALAQRRIACVLAVRDPDAACGAASAVRKLGVACRVEACDVADYGSVERCVANTLQAWGRLDIVINNAGRIEPQALIAQTDPAEWVRAISVNLVGPYHVPALRSREGSDSRGRGREGRDGADHRGPPLVPRGAGQIRRGAFPRDERSARAADPQ